MVQGIVSCIIRWTATLSTATSIIGAPLSQVYWTQQQCKMEDVMDVLGRDWISHYGKARPIEIHRSLRSVYGGDAMYVSSDAGSVFLRVVKKTLLRVLTLPTSCAATSGTVKESVSGILGERCHNPGRHEQTLKKLIQEFEGFGGTGGWNNSSSCMTTSDSTPVCAQGGNCHYGVDCFLSSSLQSKFNTLRFPAFSHPEGCNPKRPFCGWRAEIQHAWRTLTLQKKSFKLTASQSEGDFVEK